MNHFLKAADKGDPRAQAEAGYRYLKGEGVKQDLERAVKLLKQAGAQGDPMALYNLAFVFEQSSAKNNIEQALDWYRQAAEKDVLEAKLRLASIYREGKIMPSDIQETIKWTTKAAESGHVASQYNLGLLLSGQVDDVEGIETDAEKAVTWLKKAADQGHEKALMLYATLLVRGDEIAPDPAKAAQLFTQAAEKGNLVAQFNLGVLHELGQGVSLDLQEAAKWYDHAANLGHARAQFHLALLHDQGMGIPQDRRSAFEWYQRAAEQGVVDAQCAVGTFFIDGDVEEANLEKARSWFQKAERGGSIEAAAFLEKIKELSGPAE
jgi:TPR repeat protein